MTNNVPAQDGVNGDTVVTAPSGPYGLLVVPAVAAETAGRLNYNDLLPSPTLRDSVERVARAPDAAGHDGRRARPRLPGHRGRGHGDPGRRPCCRPSAPS